MKSFLRAVACALALLALASPAAAQYQRNGNHVPAWDWVDDVLVIKGNTIIAGATFTTPAGVTAYTSADLIANSATAGSVAPMQFTVCTVNGGNGAIMGVRIKTADTGFAGKKVVLKLHRDAPTYTNGDNGAWATTESNALPPITVTLSEHYSDFEKGFGTPDNNGTANGRSMFGYDCAAGSKVIYGELVAGEAATPVGAKAWTVVLEAAH